MLSPELLDTVSRLVEAQLGLHYPRERLGDLERGLQTAARESGLENVHEYAKKLARGEGGKAQIDSLATYLTIGETYFCRDPKAFEALETKVLPAIIGERQGHGRHLRIWSAGCCTGEEAYSIAIALSRVIPDIAHWHVTILATDINPKFLHKASEGVYGQWSFRGVPDAVKQKFFHALPDGRFEVLPALRKMVTFGCLNLAEDVYPSLATNTTGMDIIFCRNVLIYFSPEQLRKVLANLHRSLGEGGWLFVSASEASQQAFADFSPAGFEGTAVYRKGPPIPLAAKPAPAAFPVFHTTPDRLRTKPVAPVPKIEPPTAPAPHPAAEARRLANEGNLNQALIACDQAIRAEKIVASHYYLRGAILQEQDAIDEAILAFRRALYLDHSFVVAHFALGNTLLRQGRNRDANRCFENARSLLGDYPPEAELPESDGITAGRFLEIIASMQEVVT
jgi:chemotaxis protein methyltransferase CheR